MRWVLAAALGTSFILSTFAAFRGGYVGPDYMAHISRLTDARRIFDFSTTNPPLYYLFGYALFKVIGRQNAFPITLSILQAALNCLAMWCFFLFIARRFKSAVVFVGFGLFMTFLPVRLIHAVTLGADSATIPLFVLLLFLFDKLLVEEKNIGRNAALFGLGLSLAVATKYSFIALIPAAFIIFVSLSWKGRWSLHASFTIAALGLILPSILTLCSVSASSRVHGYNTEKHWRRKGIPADMNYHDLFSLKRADADLFRAPEYFSRRILVAHKHSYLALSHFGIFTDPMNLFQQLSVRQDINEILIPDQKTRRACKTPSMSASMSLGVIWTVAALIGAARLTWRSLKQLGEGRLEREGAAVLFGLAYFLLIFLPIPFVHGGALFGYWTPRLILPALLCFFLAAFLLIDKLAERSGKMAVVALVLALIQCGLEVTILV